MSQIQVSEYEKIGKKIQELLPKLGKSQRYQWLLIAFLSASWIVATFACMIGAFVFMNPLFQCNGDSFTEKQACQMIQMCSVQNDYTASFRNSLFCTRESQRSFIQSSFFIGNMIGVLTLNSLSDSRGRRFALLGSYISCALGVVLIMLGIYLDIWAIMAIGQMFEGAFVLTITNISYVVTGEISDGKIRQQSIMIYCAVWGFTQICFILLYYFMSEWYNYLVLLMAIPSLGLLSIAYFFLIQTPQFLLFSAKDLDKFKQSIEYLAMYNDGIPEKVTEINELGELYLNARLKQGEKKKQSQLQSMKLLFGNKRHASCCLGLGLVQAAFNFYYYGMQGTMERTGFNFGISMMLAGVHEFIGYLAAAAFVYKMRRKRSLIVMTVLCSLVGLSFMLPFVKNSQVLQSIMISVARLGSVFGYSFYALLQTQSFPSQIRSNGMGFAECVGQISKISIPFLITAMNNTGIHPIILCSILYLILGTLPLVFVQQTQSKPQEKPKNDSNDANSNKIEEKLLQEQEQNRQRFSLN